MIVDCAGLLAKKLDEVAAGVVEDGDDGGADISRRLREHHTLADQPEVLGFDVVDCELLVRLILTSVSFLLSATVE